MYLARKELRRLKTEKEQAHFDMEYADEVATKCLESILGYSLSTYQPNEVEAVGNIVRLLTLVKRMPTRLQRIRERSCGKFLKTLFKVLLNYTPIALAFKRIY